VEEAMSGRKPATRSQTDQRAAASSLSDRDRELIDYLIELTWAKILRDARSPRSE
jgi:hypothetical protein